MSIQPAHQLCVFFCIIFIGKPSLLFVDSIPWVHKTPMKCGNVGVLPLFEYCISNCTNFPHFLLRKLHWTFFYNSKAEFLFCMGLTRITTLVSRVYSCADLKILNSQTCHSPVCVFAPEYLFLKYPFVPKYLSQRPVNVALFPNISTVE